MPFFRLRLTIGMLGSVMLLITSACATSGLGSPVTPTAPPPASPTSPSPTPAGDWGSVVLEPGEPIKIGFAAALSGDVANIGINMQHSVELALEDKPAVLGRPVELVVEDSKCSEEDGRAVARKFANDPKIVGVIGHMCSASSIPASNIYEDAHLVMISPSSTAVDFTARGLKVANRVAWNDAVQGIVAAKYIFEQLGVRRVAVVHNGTAYGLGLAGIFRNAFRRLGTNTIAYERIEEGGDNFRPMLKRIVDQEPELIYFGGYHGEAVRLLRQMDELGMEDVIFFGADTIMSNLFIEQASPMAEGVYASFADLPEGSPALEAFRRRYRQKYGIEATDMGPFYAHAYDATMVLLMAIEKAAIQDGERLIIPRRALAEAVRATKNYQGLSGLISCDERGDCGSASVAIHQVQNGQWVRLWSQTIDE
ncbi:MAG: branched-chain amino acid ABC transporter substrate-binding protein [Ardenticatenia bacterium]|nr:branched-chain amino acid ABC transporter substrate-binding protein [Ardenticatenia bacterium]